MKFQKSALSLALVISSIVGCKSSDTPVAHVTPPPATPENTDGKGDGGGDSGSDTGNDTSGDEDFLFFMCTSAEKSICDAFETAINSGKDQIQPKQAFISINFRDQYDINTATYNLDKSGSPSEAVSAINKMYADIERHQVVQRLKSVRAKYHSFSGCFIESAQECSEGFEKLLNVPDMDGMKDVRANVGKHFSETNVISGYTVNFSSNQSEVDAFVKSQTAMAKDFLESRAIYDNLVKTHNIKLIVHQRLRTDLSLNFQEFTVGLKNLDAALKGSNLDFKDSVIVLLKDYIATEYNDLTKFTSIHVKYDDTPSNIGKFLKREARALRR